MGITGAVREHEKTAADLQDELDKFHKQLYLANPTSEIKQLIEQYVHIQQAMSWLHDSIEELYKAIDEAVVIR